MFDFWWTVIPIVAVLGGAAVWTYEMRRLRRIREKYPIVSTKKPKQPNQQEWMLWIGDGIEPAGSWILDRPVKIDGRTGKIIDFSALRVLVEWDN